MDEIIEKMAKKKPGELDSSRKGSTFSFSIKVKNKSEKVSTRHDEDDWDHFDPVHSSKTNDNDEFNQLQDMLQVTGNENTVGSGDISPHITQPHSFNSQSFCSSGRTPRGGGGGGSFLNLSMKKRDFASTLHPSAHSLEIIEDDKELDVSRKVKGTLKSLGSYLSFSTMKVMPRIMFGKSKKINIDDGDDICENMKIIDISAHLDTSISFHANSTQTSSLGSISEQPVLSSTNSPLLLNKNAFLLLTTTNTAIPTPISSRNSSFRKGQKELG